MTLYPLREAATAVCDIGNRPHTSICTIECSSAISPVSPAVLTLSDKNCATASGVHGTRTRFRRPPPLTAGPALKLGRYSGSKPKSSCRGQSLTINDIWCQGLKSRSGELVYRPRREFDLWPVDAAGRSSSIPAVHTFVKLLTWRHGPRRLLLSEPESNLDIGGWRNRSDQTKEPASRNKRLVFSATADSGRTDMNASSHWLVLDFVV